MEYAGSAFAGSHLRQFPQSNITGTEMSAMPTNALASAPDTQKSALRDLPSTPRTQRRTYEAPRALPIVTVDLTTEPATVYGLEKPQS